MSTNCKIIFGYTNHTNEWVETKTYQRHMDGYPEAILPIIRENIPAKMPNQLNDEIEHTRHKFEELEYSRDGITGVDYIYYIDVSNYRKIRVTVLGLDWEFYSMYNVDNYKVEKAFSFCGVDY